MSKLTITVDNADARAAVAVLSTALRTAGIDHLLAVSTATTPRRVKGETLTKRAERMLDAGWTAASLEAWLRSVERHHPVDAAEWLAPMVKQAKKIEKKRAKEVTND